MAKLRHVWETQTEAWRFYPRKRKSPAAVRHVTAARDFPCCPKGPFSVGQRLTS